MLIKKAQAGSATGYTWNEDGQVLDVEDGLAAELLSIPYGGFSIYVPEPEPEEEAPKARTSRVRDDKGRLVKKTEIAE